MTDVVHIDVYVSMIRCVNGLGTQRHTFYVGLHIIFYYNDFFSIKLNYGPRKIEKLFLEIILCFGGNSRGNFLASLYVICIQILSKINVRASMYTQY